MRERPGGGVERDDGAVREGVRRRRRRKGKVDAASDNRPTLFRGGRLVGLVGRRRRRRRRGAHVRSRLRGFRRLLDQTEGSRVTREGTAGDAARLAPCHGAPSGVRLRRRRPGERGRLRRAPCVLHGERGRRVRVVRAESSQSTDSESGSESESKSKSSIRAAAKVRGRRGGRALHRGGGRGGFLGRRGGGGEVLGRRCRGGGCARLPKTDRRRPERGHRRSSRRAAAGDVGAGSGGRAGEIGGGGGLAASRDRRAGADVSDAGEGGVRE
mmetsp:Transcript_2434/g.10464  ORF Transcript_2434/g.10464 Transcript_2434/m.10464 type:complete len:270 (-) Transcript_2434:42-851(-)